MMFLWNHLFELFHNMRDTINQITIMLLLFVRLTNANVEVASFTLKNAHLS